MEALSRFCDYRPRWIRIFDFGFRISDFGLFPVFCEISNFCEIGDATNSSGAIIHSIKWHCYLQSESDKERFSF
jgi:hypothetical protein